MEAVGAVPTRSIPRRQEIKGWQVPGRRHRFSRPYGQLCHSSEIHTGATINYRQTNHAFQDGLRLLKKRVTARPLWREHPITNLCNVHLEEVYMRIPVMVTITTAFLVGCASPAQNAALERDVDTVIQAHGPTCEKQGYSVDTHLWRNCVYQSGKQEYSNLRGTELNFPLIHRLGQRLGLIRDNRKNG
jgi:hypothetical protein